MTTNEIKSIAWQSLGCILLSLAIVTGTLIGTLINIGAIRF